MGLLNTLRDTFSFKIIIYRLNRLVVKLLVMWAYGIIWQASSQLAHTFRIAGYIKVFRAHYH